MFISPKPFPNSLNDPFIITSPETSAYNCIAYAYGVQNLSFWPANKYQSWPDGIPNTNEVSSFIALYESIGFEVCADASFENDYLKIAIYTLNGVPKHASKQLANGFWSSKLGDSYDVQHSFDAIEGGMYGNATVFMRKHI